MSDRPITPEEALERMPWIDVETGEVFFEVGKDERVFVEREAFIHLFQKYSAVVAGLANNRR